MKKKLKITVLAFIVMFIINIQTTHIVSSTSYKYPFQPDDTVIVNALEYLESQQSEEGDISGVALSAWAAMAISATGEDPHEWGNLVDYLADSVDLLDPDKVTDWERHILGVTACDEDPRDFGGYNLIQKVQSCYDGTQIIGNVYLYDDVFGVLALISAGVDKNLEIIQNLCDYIIGEETLSGGWGEVDITSVAIMALISAGKNPNSDYIQDALSFLKDQQKDCGGFAYWGNVNSASTSWAVGGIVAAGENPSSSSWQKNGNSPIDYLLSLQNEDGSFNYTLDLNMNPVWMTSYVIPALLGKPYPVKIIESDQNNPPNKPTISGPTSGSTGQSNIYSTSTIDTDGDHIQYRFDWDANGDHDYCSWTSLDDSGYGVSISHSWEKSGTYAVKAQARDSHGDSSEWSNCIIVNIESKSKNIDIKSEWTGSIRIEGKDETIWDGAITIDETYFVAKNIDNGVINDYHIEYPSVLGALVEAADIADFTYEIEYWPSFNAFYVKSIEDDSDWWHYLVDYEIPMVGADAYELTDEDNEILFGYLEQWEVHALKISIDKNYVFRHEEFIVHISDNNNQAVEDAIIYIGSESYITNTEGNVTIRIDEYGYHWMYAEKTGYIRSENIAIHVKARFRMSNSFNGILEILNFKFSKIFLNVFYK